MLLSLVNKCERDLEYYAFPDPNLNKLGPEKVIEYTTRNNLPVMISVD